MSKEPWDQPATDAGREELVRLAEQYEAEGKVREYAWTLTHLARMLKWTGTGRDDLNIWAWMHHLSKEATESFRKTDDKVGLATALRERAHPMINEGYAQAYLEESLALCTEANDIAGLGWTYHGLARLPHDISEGRLAKAREYFLAVGDKNGLAIVNRSLGIEEQDGRRFVEAADIYLELGNPVEAFRSLYAATLFGREHYSFDEREQILLRALGIVQAGQDIKYEYYALTWLANLMKDAGNKEGRKLYLAQKRKLGYKPPRA